MKKRAKRLTWAMVLGTVLLASTQALAQSITFNVSYNNVADWASWAAANTPESTSWAQDIYGRAALQLANITGTVKLTTTRNPDKFKIAVNLSRVPKLPATITNSTGTYLGTLGQSYFVTFITRMHRAGQTGPYMFNATWDRCNWIGCFEPLWQVGGFWVDDVLANNSGVVKVNKTLNGTLNLWASGVTPVPSAPYLEIVGVLVYAVQEDNQEATLIAASAAP
ncbi:MAG: hypothetical protein WHX93_02940 [bacterium]